MAKTIRQLTPEERQGFDPTRNLTQVLDADRWEAARAKLPELLVILREKYGAQRIALFGSLMNKEEFTRWSDIDLAVWGIAPESFYEAVAVLNDSSPDIKVDLVDPERCHSNTLRRIIEEEGTDI